MNELFLDRRGKNNGGRCISVVTHLGDDVLQMNHRRDDHLDHIAILSSDMMAFHDLAQGMSDSREPLVMLSRCFEMDEGKDRIPQFRWVQYCSIAGYETMIFHAPDAFGNRWRGKTDTATKFAVGQSGIILQDTQKLPPHRIKLRVRAQGESPNHSRDIDAPKSYSWVGEVKPITKKLQAASLGNAGRFERKTIFTGIL